MILLSNDDGILASGLWTLADELKKIDRVVVAAPDREQSATGTGITLRQPLRVQKIASPASNVDAYMIEGTPGDSIILALGKLLQDKIDIVVSGINSGPNLGDDVLISGTVGAALQGYLRNLPAIAISVASINPDNLAPAARLTSLIVERIKAGILPGDVFLNINVPDKPLTQIKGITITQPAHRTHIDTVEKGNDGKRDYYWLVRRKLDTHVPRGSDIWALEQGYISITPLQNTLFRRPAPHMSKEFCSMLLCELQDSAP